MVPGLFAVTCHVWCLLPTYPLPRVTGHPALIASIYNANDDYTVTTHTSCTNVMLATFVSNWDGGSGGLDAIIAPANAVTCSPSMTPSPTPSPSPSPSVSPLHPVYILDSCPGPRLVSLLTYNGVGLSTGSTYPAGANCSVLLYSNMSRLGVQLSFRWFGVDYYDKLFVYDGVDASGTLLGTLQYDQYNVQPYTSCSPYMFLQFVSSPEGNYDDGTRTGGFLGMVQGVPPTVCSASSTPSESASFSSTPTATPSPR